LRIINFSFIPEFVMAVVGNIGSQSLESWELNQIKELQEEVHEKGVSNVEEFFKKRLDGWREVEVNIAITGNSGVGKSSFINAIRE